MTDHLQIPITYEQCARLYASARTPETGKPIRNGRLYKRGDAYIVHENYYGSPTLKEIENRLANCKWPYVALEVTPDNVVTLHTNVEHPDTAANQSPARMLLLRTLGVESFKAQSDKLKNKHRLQVLSKSHVDSLPLQDKLQIIYHPTRGWQVVSMRPEPERKIDKPLKKQWDAKIKTFETKLLGAARLGGWETTEYRRDRGCGKHTLEEILDMPITRATFANVCDNPLAGHNDTGLTCSRAKRAINKVKQRFYWQIGVYYWE